MQTTISFPVTTAFSSAAAAAPIQTDRHPALPTLPPLPPHLHQETKKRRVIEIVADDDGDDLNPANKKKQKTAAGQIAGRRKIMQAVLRQKIEESILPDGQKLLGLKLHDLNQDCALFGGSKCVFTRYALAKFLQREGHKSDTDVLKEARHYGVAIKDGFERLVPIAEMKPRKSRSAANFASSSASSSSNSSMAVTLPAVLANDIVDGIPVGQLTKVVQNLDEQQRTLSAEKKEKKTAFDAKIQTLTTEHRLEQARLKARIRQARLRIKPIQNLLVALAPA